MNVFVLCPGRCGSLTFAKACEHLTNYTAGHETRTKIIGPERLTYPDNHIEVDNHLAMQLGLLERRYGDDAIYVHLTRDREKVARSHADMYRGDVSNVRHFVGGVLMRERLRAADTYRASLDFVDTVTANIEAFMATKSRTMTIDIARAADSFDDFVALVGAIGDIEGAKRELTSARNTKDRIKAQLNAPAPMRLYFSVYREVEYAMRQLVRRATGRAPLER